MSPIERTVIPVLWGLWLLYWIVTALSVKETRQRESAASQFSHVIPLVIAIIRKLTIEERLMADESGDAYARYCAEVKALILFIVQPGTAIRQRPRRAGLGQR